MCVRWMARVEFRGIPYAVVKQIGELLKFVTTPARPRGAVFEPLFHLFQVMTDIRGVRLLRRESARSTPLTIKINYSSILCVIIYEFCDCV